MASNGPERKIGLLQIAVCAVASWGIGISVGRFLPAAQTSDSLAKRLTHLCSTYEHIQASALCHTTISAKIRIEEWTEATAGRVPQDRLDAELVDFLSAVVSTEHDRFRGKVTCDHEATATPLRPEACPALPTLPARTEQAIQAQHGAGKFAVDRLRQSRYYRTLSILATAATLLWKNALFGTAGMTVGNALGARYVFWPWVCFPWYWFFRDAPAAYILCWYGFSSFAVYDMSLMRYKVSRGLIVAGLLVLTCMNAVWYVVRGSREVSFSLFCFLAVAIPLDPFFEPVLAYLGEAAAKVVGVDGVATAGVAGAKLKGE